MAHVALLELDTDAGNRLKGMLVNNFVSPTFNEHHRVLELCEALEILPSPLPLYPLLAIMYTRGTPSESVIGRFCDRVSIRYVLLNRLETKALDECIVQMYKSFRSDLFPVALKNFVREVSRSNLSLLHLQELQTKHMAPSYGEAEIQHIQASVNELIRMRHYNNGLKGVVPWGIQVFAKLGMHKEFLGLIVSLGLTRDATLLQRYVKVYVATSRTSKEASLLEIHEEAKRVRKEHVFMTCLLQWANTGYLHLSVPLVVLDSDLCWGVYNLVQHPISEEVLRCLFTETYMWDLLGRALQTRPTNFMTIATILRTFGASESASLERVQGLAHNHKFRGTSGWTSCLKSLASVNTNDPCFNAFVQGIYLNQTGCSNDHKVQVVLNSHGLVQTMGNTPMMDLFMGYVATDLYDCTTSVLPPPWFEILSNTNHTGRWPTEWGKIADKVVTYLEHVEDFSASLAEDVEARLVPLLPSLAPYTKACRPQTHPCD